jgi:hypothetical protein
MARQAAKTPSLKFDIQFILLFPHYYLLSHYSIGCNSIHFIVISVNSRGCLSLQLLVLSTQWIFMLIIFFEWIFYWLFAGDSWPILVFLIIDLSGIKLRLDWMKNRWKFEFLIFFLFVSWVLQKWGKGSHSGKCWLFSCRKFNKILIGKSNFGDFF